MTAAGGPEERVALVTGGAGSIGRATLAELVRRGIRVVCVDVDADRGREVAAELGDGARFVEADIADLASAEATVAEARAPFGRVDVLVNNAIWAVFRPAAELAVDEWSRTIDTGLGATFALSRAFVRTRDPQATDGRIVNIGSLAGQLASPGAAAYAAAKGGVAALTRVLAIELAAAGVTVNAIAPGMITSPLLGDLIDQASIEARLRRIPLGHPGRPEDVAALVGFLVSAEAGYITGQTIGVDGGWSVASL